MKSIESFEGVPSGSLFLAPSRTLREAMATARQSKTLPVVHKEKEAGERPEGGEAAKEL